MSSRQTKHRLRAITLVVMMLVSIVGPSIGSVAVSGAGNTSTIVVDADGNGDYTTIQNAVDAASPGDTIQVEPGNYTDPGGTEGHVVVDKPNLTIRGDPGDSARGPGPDAPYLKTDSGATFNLTKKADGTTITGFDGAAVGVDGSIGGIAAPGGYLENVTISQSRLSGATFSLDSRQGEELGYLSVEISGNVFYDSSVSTSINFAGEVNSGNNYLFHDINVSNNRIRSHVSVGSTMRADYRNVTVADNRMADVNLGFWGDTDGDGSTVDGVAVERNDVVYADRPGAVRLSLNGEYGPTYENVSVANNTVELAGDNFVDFGVWLELHDAGNATYDVDVVDNVVNESHQHGIYVDTSNGDESNNGPTMSATISRNEITNSGDNAIRFHGSNTDGLAAPFEVRRNVFEGNTYGITNDVPNETVDARNNYWGSSDGPSSRTGGPLEDPVTGALANGTGGTVSENGSEAGVSNVRFDPYLATPPGTDGTADFSVMVNWATSPVTEGDTLRTSVTVENTGTAQGTQTVTLNDGVTEHDSSTLTLAPGESTSFTLSWATGPGDAGDHTLTVLSEDDSDLVGVEVTAGGGSADFRVTVDSTNAPIAEGENLTVNATVENVGGKKGTQTINLSVTRTSGPSLYVLSEDSRSVTLDAGNSTTLNFSVRTTDGDAGSYTAAVASENDSAMKDVSIEPGPVENFSVAIDSTNAPVGEGENLTVNTTAENVGGKRGTQTVNFSVTRTSGPSIYVLGEGSRSVTLDAGNSSTLTFSIQTQDGDAGSYTAAVASDDDTALAGLIVNRSRLINFEVEPTRNPLTQGEALNLNVTNATASTGQPFTGTQELLFSYPPSGIDTRRAVTFDNGTATEPVTVLATGDTAPIEPGEYTDLVVERADAPAVNASYDLTIAAPRPPIVELTAIDANASAATPPTGQTVHTDGTVSFEVAANGTPGEAANAAVVLDATFTNFDYYVESTHQGGETWTATADLSSLPDDGTYRVVVTATDDMGITNETTTNVTVRLDREAPDLAATVSRLDAGKGSVNVTASEKLDGQPTIEVDKPDGTTETATVVDADSTHWNATFGLAGGGQYNVTVTGTDLAGNEETSSASTHIDTVTTENNTATVVLEPSGLFVTFTTDANVSDRVVVTQSRTPLAPLTAGQAGINFLDAKLGGYLAGNLSHAVVGIPVDKSAVPPGVDETDVGIRYYNETSSTWETQETTVEERTVAGMTREYWIANVTHFSTYGAVATDTAEPSLDAVTPSGELTPGTTSQTVRFEYSDAVSGVDVSDVSLQFDGMDVTDASNASITSQYATYEATGLSAGSYTTTVTVEDAAGNAETYETSFTILNADDDGSGGGAGPRSGGSPSSDIDDSAPIFGEFTDGSPDEAGVEVRFDDGPVRELVFEDDALEGAGNIRIAPRSEPPAAVVSEFDPDQVVTSVDIGVPAAASDSSARVKFHVSDSALGNHDPDTLQVLRVVDDGSERLPTDVSEASSGGYIVAADTPGFSTFAIVSMKQAATPTPEGDEIAGTGTPTSGRTTDPGAPDSPTATTTRTETPGGLDGFGPVVAIIALLTIGFVTYRRRN